MSRFGHLRSVENGSKDATVNVTLHGYQPPRQRGWLEPGRYAMDIVDAEWRHAASGAGINLRMTLRSALPAESANVQIDDWAYIPFDDADEATSRSADIAFNKLQHILRSVASADAGKVEALQAPGPDGKPKFASIGPAKLINKRCYVEVEAGEADVIGKDGRTRDFSNTSKVRFYIGREDFEAQPGASRQAPKSAASQKDAPEIAAPSGNGAKVSKPARANQAEVAALVDI